MPVAFASAAARASAVVQGTFGEAAVVRPMSSGVDLNGRPEPDPDRAVLPIAFAVFREVVEDKINRNPWDSRAVERLQEIGAALSVKFAVADLSRPSAFEPVAGDVVERTATGVRYSVIAPVARTRVNVTFGLALAHDDAGEAA